MPKFIEVGVCHSNDPVPYGWVMGRQEHMLKCAFVVFKVLPSVLGAFSSASRQSQRHIKVYFLIIQHIYIHVNMQRKYNTSVLVVVVNAWCTCAQELL